LDALMKRNSSERMLMSGFLNPAVSCDYLAGVIGISLLRR
jgi:hypothetical protein